MVVIIGFINSVMAKNSEAQANVNVANEIKDVLTFHVLLGLSYVLPIQQDLSMLTRNHCKDFKKRRKVNTLAPEH